MAWLRKINNRYYLHYRDEYTRKINSKPLGKLTKKQAEKAKNHFEVVQDNPPPAGMVFVQFAEKYLLWHDGEYPASTQRIHQLVRQHLLPVFQFMQIGVIRPHEVEIYKSARLKLAASETVAKELRTLKAILNKAVEWNVIASNPIKFVKTPKNTKSAPPPFYTTEQLKELYGMSSDIYANVWRFAANTGLRRGELVNLKKENLREQGIYVVSTNQNRTKSGKWRQIPWSDGSRVAIDNLSDLVDGEFVIPEQRPDSLSLNFRRTVARCTVGGSLHWLRHSCASHLVMAGFPLRVVQQVMGHSTIAVTERYAHLADDYMRDKMEGFRV